MIALMISIKLFAPRAIAVALVTAADRIAFQASLIRRDTQL